jgi:hypothetical protein
MTFDELVALCAESGEPLRLLSATETGWQANLQSSHNSIARYCGLGATPTDALMAVMIQRGHWNKMPANPSVDDLI